MCYKIRNILCLSVLALVLGFSNTSVKAQGVVTLADGTGQDDGALNKDIPDEISLFDDSTGMDELGISAPKREAPQPMPDLTAQHSGTMAPIGLPRSGDEQNTFKPFVPGNNPAETTVSETIVEETNLPQFGNKLMSAPGAGIGVLGGNDITPIDDKVFSQMSDLEKQTALLNLELRREKVKNDIEAIKNQRKLAIEQEKEKEEQKARQKIEWEKAQEAKVVQEQQKLRELDIQFEKQRQERLLKSYKNKMLEENQKWISNNADLYTQIGSLRKEKSDIIGSTKDRFNSIKTSILSANGRILEAKANYQREIADLQTQISILKARIDAQSKEMEKQNPFAEGDNAANATAETSATSQVAIAEPETKLSGMYAVMEIRGQGGELIAKLINQDGSPFYVKRGTSLQSGHIIDEITSTYIRADKGGMKDYLYFASGGILPLEPIKSDISPNLRESTKDALEESRREFVTSDGVPGMGRDMIAR